MIFIFRFLVFIFLIFVVLSFFLAAFAWLRIRTFLQNPFLKQGVNTSPVREDEEIIEGEYRVLDESRRE